MGTLKEFTNHDGSHKQQPYIGSCYNLLHVSHSYMMPAIDFFFWHSIRSGSSLMPAIRQFIYACFLDGRPKQGQASLWHFGPPRRRLRVRPSPRGRGPLALALALAGTRDGRGMLRHPCDFPITWPLAVAAPAEPTSAVLQCNAKAGGGGREAVACRNWPPGTPAGSRAINHKWPVKRVA